MKNSILICLLAVMAFPALAEKRGNTMRGGWGFLFPDANSFVNGGQASLNKSTSVEANYLREDLTQDQDLTASLAWANGHAALGAAMNRTGALLAEPESTTDKMYVQGGFAFGGGQFTVGAVYGHSLEAGVVGADDVSGQLNIHLGKPGQGWVLGFGAGTTLGRDTNTTNGIGALGYAFSSGLMLEAAYQVDNLSDSANSSRYKGGVVYNSSSWYGAAQYSAATIAGANTDSVSARLGGIWGAVDVSGQVIKETYTGGTTSYGGTIRYVF